MTNTQLDIEKKQILIRYKTLLTTCKNIVSRDDIKLVRKAFELSLLEHGETRVVGGYPAVYRSLSIAQIVVGELGLGRTSLICALLYDVTKNSNITAEEIKNLFGPKVLSIIEGLSRVTDIYNDNKNLLTENFRKLLFTFADDVRVVLIILADRLYNLRNIDAFSREKQMNVCEEIKFLYLPLAHRLGMYNVKSEMEDSTLRIMRPEIYFSLVQKLKDSEEKRNIYINNFVAPIKKDLSLLNLKYKIKARTKTISSILHKMEKTQVEFEEVYDIFAIRIIMDIPVEKEKMDCWQVYSAVTDLYRPNPNRMRDWVSVPKTNGYESLHTTVMGPDNRWVEVQIRSERMDNIAEQGFAAHWRYKGVKDGGGGLDNWLSDIREVLESSDNDSMDIIDRFKADLYNKEIYVFTPKGELKQLIVGSTLLDFAYSIHSDLGDKCIGGTVNQKNVSIRYVLQNGDQVSITKSSKQHPNHDWLNFVVTTRAKNRIRQTLKEEEFKNAEEGKEILKRRMKNWKLDFSEDNIQKLLSNYKYKVSSDFFCALADEEIDISKFKEILLAKKEDKKLETEVSKPLNVRLEKRQEDVLIVDENIKDVDYSLSSCCNPIFGDEIFGFISIGRGIRIHRISCSNANEMQTRYPYRLVKASWTEKGDASYQAVLHITGLDEFGIVNSITELITRDLRVQMRSIALESKDGVFEGKLSVSISNINSLNTLIAKLKKINGVHKVSRYDA